MPCRWPYAASVGIVQFSFILTAAVLNSVGCVNDRSDPLFITESLALPLYVLMGG